MKRRVHRMKRRMTKSMHIAFAVAGIGLGSGLTAAHGQTAANASRPRISTLAAVDPMWKESFDAFAAADKATPPKPGGVLFVGSSSIRLWNDLESQFKSEPIVTKRGFGGSRLSDLARYVPQLVLPYEPSLVVVYAGDNDIAEGRTPEEVLQSFQSIVGQIHDALPEARIAYISIKPSPSRAAVMASTLKTNQLIEAYTQTDKSLDFIDIYDKMLGADGKPRAELFQADMLHLNPDGYAIWQAEIKGHLHRTQGPGSSSPALAAAH
jgi:lysophospholipase L1-like esterase